MTNSLPLHLSESLDQSGEMKVSPMAKKKPYIIQWSFSFTFIYASFNSILKKSQLFYFHLVLKKIPLKLKKNKKDFVLKTLFNITSLFNLWKDRMLSFLFIFFFVEFFEFSLISIKEPRFLVKFFTLSNGLNFI